MEARCEWNEGLAGARRPDGTRGWPPAKQGTVDAKLRSLDCEGECVAKWS
ncbi:hypothetical protein Hanom_Chr12g01113451 [Helianthus anomalus]